MRVLRVWENGGETTARETSDKKRAMSPRIIYSVHFLITQACAIFLTSNFIQQQQTHPFRLNNESTLNLLYSILKPDVLRADELVEFSQKSNTSNVSSMWSMSSGIVSSSSTSSLDQKQHQNQQHENDQLLFVSQLNSNTAAQMLVAAAANDLQTVF